jgi:hypothetical protein
MRYPVSRSADGGIALPSDLAAELGEPAEVEAERVSAGLLLHPGAGR